MNILPSRDDHDQDLNSKNKTMIFVSNLIPWYEMLICFRKSFIDVPPNPSKDKICFQDINGCNSIKIGSDYQATIPNLEADDNTLTNGENI